MNGLGARPAPSLDRQSGRYDPCPTHDGYCVVVLVGDHAVAVHLLLVNPALVVEGLSDKGRLHERNVREGHNFILPSGASGLGLTGCAMPLAIGVLK